MSVRGAVPVVSPVPPGRARSLVVVTVALVRQVVRSGKTLKFSTQDTTLLQEDTHGTMRQSTHKHADADAKMIDAIGVPKVGRRRIGPSLHRAPLTHASRPFWSRSSSATRRTATGRCRTTPPCRRSWTPSSTASATWTQSPPSARRSRSSPRRRRCAHAHPLLCPLPPLCLTRLHAVGAQEYKADLARTEELQKEAAVQRGNRAEVRETAPRAGAQARPAHLFPRSPVARRRPRTG